MIRHTVMWKFKEGTDVGKIKLELEGLNGQIPGLLSLEVGTAEDSAVLISDHESWEALDTYAKHPLHVAVADSHVRPYIVSRQAVNYEKAER